MPVTPQRYAKARTRLSAPRLPAAAPPTGGRKGDQRPIYVCKAGSHWVALEELDPQRSESAYYYLHFGGLTAYGPDAEGEVRARLKGPYKDNG